MRTCPKCRAHSYAYREHPIYGMVYICARCKVEGAVLVPATQLHREVRRLSPLCWYYGSGGEKFSVADITG